MKEIRALLLLFYSFIAARLLSETSSCQSGLETVCSVGITIVVPIILSGYFLDSVLAEWLFGQDNKNKNVMALLSLPYIISVIVYSYTFFSTFSLVTMEYILNFYLLIMLAIFYATYWLNNHPKIRRLNKVFMVTFFVALLVFQFV